MARSAQLVSDVGNILVCVRHLLTSICVSGAELLGLAGPGSNKAARDVHAKCHDLLCTLLLRGCPLAIFYKVKSHALHLIKHWSLLIRRN
jgi:hypothetical protein